jgi:hypothetical protein
VKQLLIPALLAIAAIVALDSPGLIDFGINEVPVVNLPMELRQSNYTCCRRHPGNGSCVHVSWIMLLQWQNKPELAAWWKSHYKGGEGYEEFCQRNNAAGITYASTSNENNVAFLEWAIKTRRGCIVGVGVTKVKKLGPTHMVCLVHLDSERAGILDNNDIKQIHWMPRDKFLAWWQQSYSWASTPLYSPAAPLPFGGTP